MASKRRARPRLETCPHCGASFRAGRPACPECGSDAETGWRPAEEIDYQSVELPEDGAAWSPDGPAPSARPGSASWLVALLLVAVLAVLVALGAF